MNVIACKDLQLFYWLFSCTQNRSLKFVRLVSKTGDGYLYAIAAIFLLLFTQQGTEFLQLGLAAFAIELPLYLVLKNTFKRSRPCDVVISAHITPSDKFSLPSGHSAAAFLMATLLSYYWPAISLLVLGWAGLIGLSRILLGVHYPSDVLIGAILGVSSALFCIQAFG